MSAWAKNNHDLPAPLRQSITSRSFGQDLEETGRTLLKFIVNAVVSLPAGPSFFALVDRWSLIRELLLSLVLAR